MMTQGEFSSALTTAMKKDRYGVRITLRDGTIRNYPTLYASKPPVFTTSIDGVLLPGDAEERPFSDVISVEAYDQH